MCVHGVGMCVSTSLTPGQGVIQPLIQYCTKKKRREASKLIAAIYNLSADLDLSVDASKSLGKQRRQRTFQLPEGSIALPTRYCGPTSSQVRC